MRDAPLNRVSRWLLKIFEQLVVQTIGPQLRVGLREGLQQVGQSPGALHRGQLQRSQLMQLPYATLHQPQLLQLLRGLLCDLLVRQQLSAELVEVR